MPASNRRSEIEIRAATASDADAIVRLIAEVAAEGKWLATEPPVDSVQTRISWLENVVPGSGLTLVALCEHRVIGELSLRPAESGTVVLGMLVEAGWRGHGVGSRLIDAALAWTASRLEIRRIELAVFPHNDTARALYRKYGFVEIEVREAAVPRRNGEAWDIILMRRDLRG